MDMKRVTPIAEDVLVAALDAYERSVEEGEAMVLVIDRGGILRSCAHSLFKAGAAREAKRMLEEEVIE